MCKCVACKDVITNPICPECLEEGIGSWLAGVKPKISHQLRSKTFEVDTVGDVKCIKCKRSRGLCPYCYTKHIFSWLRTEHSELALTFLEIFNFDLERKGYAKGLI